MVILSLAVVASVLLIFIHPRRASFLTARRRGDFSCCVFKTVRHVARLDSSTNYGINPFLSLQEMQSGCRLGIDSHADTTCVNHHAFIQEIVEGQTVDAVPFDSSIGKLEDLPIVHAILAVDNNLTHETHLLRLNNSIYVKSMENCLLCPNQAREFGTVIDDIPIHLDHTGVGTFSMITSNVQFPLSSFGPTAFTHVRRPTDEELDTLIPIDITDSEDWDPYGHNSRQIYSVTRSSNVNWHYEEHPLDGFLLLETLRQISSLNVSKPKDSVTPEYLAQIWNCGIDTARKTLQATTCRYYRQITKGMTRRFRTRRNLLRYKQLAVPAGEFYSDTLKAKVCSVRGYTYAQVFGNKFGFVKVYPMQGHDKTMVGDTLTLLVQDVGVPQKLHVDNAPEMVGRGTPFFRRARKEGIDLTSIEPERPDQNYGEILVGRVKLLTAKLMQRKNVPMRLWCYAMEYASELSCIIVPGMYRNRGRSGYEITLGTTPDISEYVEFDFYDYCWYWDSPQFPQEKRNLGRWLGIAHRVGQAMVYYVMNVNGQVVARSTVTPLEPSEGDVSEIKQRMLDLDETISNTIGDYRNAGNEPRSLMPEISDDDLKAQLSYCLDIPEDSFDTNAQEHYSDSDRPEYDDSPSHDVESSAFDKFLGLTVEIPGSDGASKVLGKVTGRKRDAHGVLIGTSNENPILNTALYEVTSPDGTINEYTANVIAENLWNQTDDDGYNYSLLYEIIGHRRDDTAVPIKEGFYETPSGQRRRVITSKGWQFNISWENGETSWISLKEIKESNPIEVAEYAVANKLESEPAFAWWVKTALKRRNAQISAASRRVRIRQKFGIKLPKDYKEAVDLDRANGNTLWQDATRKEMKNVEIAFQFTDHGTKPPPGFREITCHLVFDVKFTLDRKARYVAGGHRTEVPASMTYSSVVSRDSVRIMLLVAALNDLEMKMCDIGNAYLQAETREKLWFKAGAEWGDRKDCIVIVTRALYGLKSSGAEWKKTFASYIKHTLGFDACIGCDDDVYMKLQTDEHGNEYYSYITCYVDDVLVLHRDPNKFMNMINRDYRLKNPPEVPTMYLGADISVFTIPDTDGTGERTAYAMSADSHIKKALQMLETRLNQDHVHFKSSKTAEHPFTSQSYRPELDITEYCNDDQTQFYQSLVGIMRWLTEIGRLDILTETSLLSSQLATPRQGHLHQAVHIFKYLKDHKRSKIVFDPVPVYIHDDHLQPTERSTYRAAFMKELYPDATEDIPKNAPSPKGKGVTITAFVDSDHAGDKITRRSRTGIIIFVNKAPIMWFSKRQNTVETSTYGAEMVAMRQAMDMIKSLKYKLRMFGIPIIEDGVRVLGDNNSVIINTSHPESTLKKKHHSINFHYVRECVAAKVALIMKVDTNHNLADLFTKILDKEKRKYMIQRILW